MSLCDSDYIHILQSHLTVFKSQNTDERLDTYTHRKKEAIRMDADSLYHVKELFYQGMSGPTWPLVRFGLYGYSADISASYKGMCLYNPQRSPVYGAMPQSW